MIKKILIVVGTRPNFIKVTQFKKCVKNFPSLDIKIVHTGQHYDDKMADVFFKQFDLTPDFFLNITPGSPNYQIAEVMIKLEELINTNYHPDLMVVVGDVNSTLAGSLTANKMGIKLAHLESGLRSFDNEMPEEINRIITDKLSDVFFVTEPSGEKNLKANGIAENQILFSGNTMIDTLVAFEKQIDEASILETLKLESQKFVLMTMHRPSNVDSNEGLLKLCELMKFVSQKYKIVFPIHPRTLKKLDDYGMKNTLLENNNLVLVDPLDYFSFQKLIKYCKFVLTDSGGIQEESTFLKIPCLTLRLNTERPVTVTEGTNTLVPFDVKQVIAYIQKIEDGTYKKGSIPKYWDGKSTQRILQFISQLN